MKIEKVLEVINKELEKTKAPTPEATDCECKQKNLTTSIGEGGVKVNG